MAQDVLANSSRQFARIATTGRRLIDPSNLEGVNSLLRCSNHKCQIQWSNLLHFEDGRCFEGMWCCSARCLVEVVTRWMELRRTLSGTEERMDHPTSRTPLGLLMLAQGWITYAEMRKALSVQSTYGWGRFGDWLITECAVEPRLVTAALSIQQDCPIFDADVGQIEEIELLPEGLSTAYGCIPLRFVEEKEIQLGVSKALDRDHLRTLRHMTGVHFRQGFISDQSYDRLFSRFGNRVSAGSTRRYGDSTLPIAKEIALLIYEHRGSSSSLAYFGRHLWLRICSRTDERSQSAKLVQAFDFIFGEAE